MKKLIFGLIIILFGLFIFLKYGRSIYVPVTNAIGGPETVESIAKKIEGDVLKRLQPNFDRLGLTGFPTELLLVGLKEERVLEVYVGVSDGFELLKRYPFTAYSGQLGPKLKEGDRQIPEGIYRIEYLNPNSSYYLSMKVNYPNEFDLEKTTYENKLQLGGDIFIHGKAATIGCIPIGDSGIEELFMLVKNAVNKNIKVIISPRDFRNTNEIPDITGINWESELYEMIKRELNVL